MTEAKDNKQETILIVDDDPAVSKLIRRSLGSLFRVIRAEGVLEGFEALKTDSVDLILLDISLPGLSGLELCRRLKEDSSLQHIPVIFVTGFGSTEDRVNGFVAGGVDYLSKPFQIDDLLSRVTNALKKAA